MDLLAIGSAWLEQTRAAYAASDVLYVRAASSATVKATIGRQVFEADEGNGIFTRVETRDYLILVADLILDDVPLTPAVGDRIMEGEQGTAVVYEVISPAGLPHWQYSDPARLTYRIHTKYVGTQPTFQS